MTDPANFTVKEIVIEIKETLEAHIEKTDKRLKELEQHRSGVVKVFNFVGWLVGSGVITGLFFVFKDMISK